MRTPGGMLSLSDLLLRLPGLVYPDVGLTDCNPGSDSSATSGLAGYLLISDALDLNSQKKISYSGMLSFRMLDFWKLLIFQTESCSPGFAFVHCPSCSNKKHYCKPDVI